MANYYFPPSLFPSDSCLEALAACTVRDPGGKQAPAEVPLFDKELDRFMKPSIAWHALTDTVSYTPEYTQISASSWLADYENVPVQYQPHVQELLRFTLFEEFTIANLVYRTARRTRILYLADDAYVSLPSLMLDNTTFLSEILYIYVAEGVTATVEDTLSLTGTRARLISATIGTGAQLTFISHHESHASSGSGAGYGLFHERWSLEPHARLTALSTVTGGRQTWAYKEYHMSSDAQIDTNNYFALAQDEQSALITQQHHEGPRSTSSVEVKVALAGSAHSFYRGTIAISPEGKKADANQQQKALLLSRAARACAIPSLEVAIDEVSCRHGSAAGRYNADELLFLTSRGLDETHAQSLLLEGFYANETLKEHAGYDERIKLLKNHLMHE